MDSLNKRYYKIGEVAEILGLPESTLRFWEKKFTVIRPRRTDGGTRYYTPRDIEIIQMIHYLVKDKGLKLEAAQEEIRRNRSGVEKRHDVIRRLQDIRSQLTSILRALDNRKL